MSVWTNNLSIMQDLSKAQGRLVPVDMNSRVGVAVGANEKPPQIITEETEEEFYKKFACGDVDYSAAPDYGLIQKMIEMVREGDDDSSDCSISDTIQITKMNAPTDCTKTKINKAKKSHKGKQMQAEFKLNEAKDKNIEATTEFGGGDAPVQKKRQRNVAMTSLLAAWETKQNNDDNIEPIKLLKPTDFISTKAVTESVRKVDEWFTNKENSVRTNANKHPSLSPASMFKKKSVPEKPVNELKIKENKSPNSPSENTGSYKPSSMADEYYKKYLKKSQLKDSLNEDIWQKAERLMKEADAKRAAEAARKKREETPKCIINEVLQEVMNNIETTSPEDGTSSSN
ncbi:male determiner protein Mdmd(III) isoform X2 [Amyelois transitella]|uniref:male determiner protein Mdmd(III) isoform X2 n=1 Tax=Amyelois transitella TaxID=680683 RepID=UPI00067CB109|nr:male determiner protein Mdmd(III) isoform X2 [Amyelois transitella]